MYIEVIFKEDGEGLLKISELSELLYNLKVFYSAAFKSFGEKITDVESNPERIENIARSIVDKIKQENFTYLPYIYRKYYYFRKDFKDKDIFIAKIYKESPLTIWFMGISTILVAAFIISGGEMEIGVAPPKIRIIMPSIAEALRKIKEVFKK